MSVQFIACQLALNKEIFVDGGPTLKRIRPQPMGRAFRVLKRQSHVTIKLDTRKGEDS